MQPRARNPLASDRVVGQMRESGVVAKHWPRTQRHVFRGYVCLYVHVSLDNELLSHQHWKVYTPFFCLCLHAMASPLILWRLLLAAATVSTVNAVSLSDVCTSIYAQSALPSYPGITIDASSTTTYLVTNSSVSSDWYPTATIEYCNVTFAYSHNGISGDVVHVTYWVPAPDAFQNRYGEAYPYC
jgi:hypothetical protein